MSEQRGFSRKTAVFGPYGCVERTVKHGAADSRHGMTLDELAAFVAEARREQVPGDTTVKITATWRQSIREARLHVAECGQHDT